MRQVWQNPRQTPVLHQNAQSPAPSLYSPTLAVFHKVTPSFAFSFTQAHFLPPVATSLSSLPVLKEWPVCYTMVIKVCSDWKYIRTPYHFNARALICQDTGCNWILIGY